MTTENQKKFSGLFVKKLGELVKAETEEALKVLSKNEIQAILSETFYLLGRAHKKLGEKADIK